MNKNMQKKKEERDNEKRCNKIIKGNRYDDGEVDPYLEQELLQHFDIPTTKNGRINF